MAEDLGEITIKFGDSGSGGGGASQEAFYSYKLRLEQAQEARRIAAEAKRVQEKQIKDAQKYADELIAQQKQGIDAFKSIVAGGYGTAMIGLRGGGLGNVLSSAKASATNIASAGVVGGAIGTTALGIGAALGIVAVAATAIASIVSNINDRVSQLSTISGPMALQEATNRLSEMRRDMREAQILGPMYTQVSQLVNKIKDLLQPFLMAFRAALLSVIIPILEQIVKYLQSLFNLIPVIAMALSQSAGTIQSVGGMGGVFKAISRASMGVGGMGTQVGGLFGVLSWLFPPSKTSGAANTLNTIASVLMRFYQSFQNQQQHSGGRWALDTLNTLATGGLVNVPGVPGVMPIRTAPARRARSGGQVP